MKKKIIAFILAVCVALGISLPLALLGGGKQTPEQYFQQLAGKTHLTWQNESGVEVAKYPAGAENFVVEKNGVEIDVSATGLNALSPSGVASAEAVIAKFFVHYTGYADGFQGAILLGLVGSASFKVHGVTYAVITGP